MAGALVAFDEKGFAVSYFVKSKVLRITATGKIAGVVLSAWIQRDTYLGGLKFSLLGYYGGLGPVPPTKDANIPPYEEHINLLLSHFQYKTVQIETLGKTYTIPIRYLLGDTDDSEELEIPDFITDSVQPKIGVQVLPPICIDLPGGKPGEHTAIITAPVPTGTDYHVETRFNENVLRTWKSGVRGGQLYWYITWEHTPDPPTKEESFDVATEKWVGPGFSGLWEIIQPYTVRLTLLA